MKNFKVICCKCGSDNLGREKDGFDIFLTCKKCGNTEQISGLRQ